MQLAPTDSQGEWLDLGNVLVYSIMWHRYSYSCRCPLRLAGAAGSWRWLCWRWRLAPARMRAPRSSPVSPGVTLCRSRKRFYTATMGSGLR